MATFGERFKALRLEKELTQEELVYLFNNKYDTAYRVASISQYENNKRRPELKQLEDWSEFFGVSIDYLLGRTDIRDFEENTIAAHMDDRTKELSEDGLKQLDNFIDFLIAQEKRKR